MRRLSILAVLLLVAGCADLVTPAPSGPRFVVFFQEWSAAIDDPAGKAIAGAADWAKQHPGVPLIVTGYADPTGSVAANASLTRLRAQVVSDALVQDGVAESRIRRHAAGSVAFAGTSQESRRVVIAAGAE